MSEKERIKTPSKQEGLPRVEAVRVAVSRVYKPKRRKFLGWRGFVARKTPLCFVLNSSDVQEVAPCFSC